MHNFKSMTLLATYSQIQEITDFSIWQGSQNSKTMRDLGWSIGFSKTLSLKVLKMAPFSQTFQRLEILLLSCAAPTEKVVSIFQRTGK